jgi:putative two-component system response regulator
VAQHHEWIDDSGYPAGLSGENISLHARIVALADTYDATTSDPYRTRLTATLALQIIRRLSGRQFDPRIVGTFAGLAEARQLD